MIGGILEKHWEMILGTIQKHRNIQEIVLYGSRAKGNFNDGSDIDLALKGKNITSKQLTQIELDYEDLYLPWKLQLTVYNTISNSDLKEHIDRAGIKLGNHV